MKASKDKVIAISRTARILEVRFFDESDITVCHENLKKMFDETIKRIKRDKKKGIDTFNVILAIANKNFSPNLRIDQKLSDFYKKTDMQIKIGIRLIGCRPDFFAIGYSKLDFLSIESCITKSRAINTYDSIVAIVGNEIGKLNINCSYLSNIVISVNTISESIMEGSNLVNCTITDNIIDSASIGNLNVIGEVHGNANFARANMVDDRGYMPFFFKNRDGVMSIASGCRSFDLDYGLYHWNEVIRQLDAETLFSKETLKSGERRDHVRAAMAKRYIEIIEAKIKETSSS